MKHSLTFIIILAIIILPPIAYLNSNSNYQHESSLSSSPLASSTNLTILGPGNKTQPVVNEGSTTQLMVVDASGNKVTDVTYSSGSPEVAMVDQQSGLVRGVLFGFATITATRSNGDSISAFVDVVRF